MPIYEYQCVDCNELEQRVAGIDDHIALCVQCGGLMLRLDEDVFRPYFEEVSTRSLEESVGQDFQLILTTPKTI
jgi:putative FmdB family regulatory protein